MKESATKTSTASSRKLTMREILRPLSPESRSRVLRVAKRMKELHARKKMMH